MSRLRFAALILGPIAAVALLAGCASGHGAAIDPSAGAGPTAPTTALAPGVDHVHGAVVVDGRLLLGTHTGLVEAALPSGRTERIGETKDDIMGLAATGATLFASGHPGEGNTLPDPLGLLRSDDGGVTWQPVSLTGEVDFHGLTADGDRIAGIGTRDGVLVSSDGGATWQDIGVDDATSVAWFQGALWFTSPDGLRTWRDGAVADVPMTGAAPLVLAAAGDGSALWPCGPTGRCGARSTARRGSSTVQ